MIVCNNSDVCKVIKELVPIQEDKRTSYVGTLEGNRFDIVLSGFIGRIDDHFKKASGKRNRNEYAKSLLQMMCTLLKHEFCEVAAKWLRSGWEIGN